MADAAAWAAVGISVVALGITTAQWIQSRQQQQRIDQIAKEQTAIEARQAVNDIVTTWNNTMISRPMLVHDHQLRELADRARRWRDDVTPYQSRLMANTGGVRTFAYSLVRKNVDAVMQFGSEVEAIMDEKLEYNAQYDKVQHSVTRMQAIANPAISDLDNLRGDELLRPG